MRNYLKNANTEMNKFSITNILAIFLVLVHTISGKISGRNVVKFLPSVFSASVVTPTRLGQMLASAENMVDPDGELTDGETFKMGNVQEGF